MATIGDQLDDESTSTSTSSPSAASSGDTKQSSKDAHRKYCLQQRRARARSQRLKQGQADNQFIPDSRRDKDVDYDGDHKSASPSPRSRCPSKGSRGDNAVKESSSLKSYEEQCFAVFQQRFHQHVTSPDASMDMSSRKKLISL